MVGPRDRSTTTVLQKGQVPKRHQTGKESPLHTHQEEETRLLEKISTRKWKEGPLGGRKNSQGPLLHKNPASQYQGGGQDAFSHTGHLRRLQATTSTHRPRSPNLPMPTESVPAGQHRHYHSHPPRAHKHLQQQRTSPRRYLLQAP